MTARERTGVAWPERLLRVRISEAQASALECAGLGAPPFEADETRLHAAWDGDRVIAFRLADRDVIAAAVNALSNAEDWAAENDPDPGRRAFARRASRSLAALYGTLLRLPAARGRRVEPAGVGS